jgi:hypothetical protein
MEMVRRVAEARAVLHGNTRVLNKCLTVGVVGDERGTGTTCTDELDCGNLSSAPRQERVEVR